MKKLLAGALATAAIFGTAFLHAAQAPKILNFSWNITVDADGRVTRLDSEGKLVPDLKDRLEREIRTWRFKPGTINGQAAATESRLYVALQATPIDDERSALHVIRAATGGGYGKMVPPRYPAASVSARRQGLVLLQVHYDENGQVVESALYEKAPQADKALVDAAIAAVKRWTFAPEVVGGRPLASTALVPVCFSLHGAGIRPPKCDWERPGESAANASRIAAAADDTTPAFDSALKFETAVAGRTP
ncbi:energy transducer TonB [Dokdonella sp.]|uniref:energy transducer TonB n=1 Tax=Dokdonella sp. TaxID=2291710 RepID=UPI001B229527|nr:energy transducer TonB [Dokdonella sp.]MBO9663652.1 energy transducer TonB [Dokdonella sp.]